MVANEVEEVAERQVAVGRKPVAGAARDDEPAGVRERILQAAIAEFARTGFHITALRTICERSGSNKPMVYYHFQGKDGLYLAAVRRMLEETAARVRAATDSDLPVLDRLRRYAEVYLDAFVVSCPLLGTALRELEGLDESLRRSIVEEYVRLVLPQLQQILADGVGQGAFRSLDVDACVSGITSLLHGYIHHRTRTPDLAMRTAISQLMDYYTLGLLSRATLESRLAAGAMSITE
jgi:AcrR family transcriptional regulator